MGFTDSLKAVWNDPKKRPWVIAGVGAAGTAGILMARRPTDPEDAVSEDTAVAESTPPSSGPAYDDYSGYVGAIPPAAYGGFGVGYDPGFEETDLSGVYEELDSRAAELQEDYTSQIEGERAQRRKQTQRQGTRINRQRQKINQQQKINRQQRKQIQRLKKRTKQGPKKKAQSKRKPARRRARAGAR